jgi:glycosyltransferase involved in cell wall biosynthesis
VGGGSEYKAELERKYKDDTDITFHGFVSEEKKLELLERATILSSASMKEGYGLVIIEASAMGTPSVVYNVDGFNEAVIDGKTGFLTDPTPNALAEGIISLLGTRNSELATSLYSSLSVAAHERSKEFTFNRTTDAFEQILQSS